MAISARELRAHFSPQPKPRFDRQRRTKTHDKRMAQFRDDVWANAGVEVYRLDLKDQAAPCEECQKTVYRRSFPFGAVDHIRRRSTCPEEKYNPSNGRVICQLCHDDKHLRRPR